jgi:hypothetical protein
MHAIDELLQTERDYVYDLNHLTKVSVQKKKKKRGTFSLPFLSLPFCTHFAFNRARLPPLPL